MKRKGMKGRWIGSSLTQLCGEQLWPWHQGTQVGWRMWWRVRPSLWHAHDEWRRHGKKGNRKRSAQQPCNCALPWLPYPSSLPISLHSQLHPSHNCCCCCCCSHMVPVQKKKKKKKPSLHPCHLVPLAEEEEKQDPELVQLQTSQLHSADLHMSRSWVRRTSHSWMGLDTRGLLSSFL